MARERKVRMRIADNQVFEVEQAVAFQSHTIKSFVDLAGIDRTVPLDEVEGPVLAKVFQYCQLHLDVQKYPLLMDDIEEWEKEFVNVDHYTLLRLLRAADYLGIRNLVNLTCDGIARLRKGKNVLRRRKL